MVAAAAMTEIASADIPLAVDRVDRARGGGDGVTLRMSGRWLRPADAAQSQPLLVVQVQGRRHRFAPIDGADGPALGSGAWGATFNLPAWAEPNREGQAALWVGTAVVPVPLPGPTSTAAATAPPAQARTQREVHAAGERARRELAELIAARDALTAEVADLRARMAATQAGHQQHDTELAALRDQLASAQVSRDAAVGEAAGLRAELERLGSELAVTREHHAAQGWDLGEAQRLLAEARSMSEQLRSQSPQ